MTTQIYPEIYLHALINMYKCTDWWTRINTHVNKIWKLMDMDEPCFERIPCITGITTRDRLALNQTVPRRTGDLR